MKEIKIKGWRLLIDPDRTRQVLQNIKSDAETCGCSYCRNFIASREQAYPGDFLNVLQRLGIDLKKDVQTSHIVRLENELHQYQVDYCFIGKILEGVDKNIPLNIESFNFTISDEILYREKEFPKPVLVLQCFPQVAWIINEKEISTEIDC